MARTTTQHTVVVRSANRDGVLRDEEVGTGSIIPGEALEYDTNGYVQRVSTAGVATPKLVAMENPTPDTDDYPTTAAVDIPYADGDTVQFAVGKPGDVFNMRLADGESVTQMRDFLIPNDAGQLTSCGTGISVGTSNPIGIAWETVDASGTAARCQVLIV